MANVKLIVFHDERFIPGWLYHAFILCEPGYLTPLQTKLLDAKSEADCDERKRIHFSNLRSGSHGSSRTRAAIEWAKLLVNDFYRTVWFFLFGVNRMNLDYEFFGPSSNGQVRDFRIYNTFFQIGLFSACRFFFDKADQVELLDIYSEKRSLPPDDPFVIHAPYVINQREANVYVGCSQVTQVAGDISREHRYPGYVDVLNFVDVIMGGFSQAIDCTSRARGCSEVAEVLLPLCRRLSENPYNVNSRYYKRCAISFFPKYKYSKSEIVQHGVLPPDNQFYHKRSLRLHQPCFEGFEELLD